MTSRKVGRDTTFPLKGIVIGLISFDYAVSLGGEGFHVRINNNFQVRSASGEIFAYNSPDMAASSTQSQAAYAMIQLLNVEIHYCQQDRVSLNLKMGFGNGLSLEVPPDPDYEAWTLNLPSGEMTVCMPGGELA